MLKSEAISVHANGHSHKFAVFAWEEGGKLVTQVDGKRHVARNVFEMETWDLLSQKDMRNIRVVSNIFQSTQTTS